MNLRQAVTLAVLVGSRILDCDPSYLAEKLFNCNHAAVPEVILDSENRAKFRQYAERWGMDWDTERDLKRPISELLEEAE